MIHSCNLNAPNNNPRFKAWTNEAILKQYETEIFGPNKNIFNNPSEFIKKICAILEHYQKEVNRLPNDNPGHFYYPKQDAQTRIKAAVAEIKSFVNRTDNTQNLDELITAIGNLKLFQADAELMGTIQKRKNTLSRKP